MGQFGVCAKRLFQTPGGVSGSVTVGNDNVTSTLAAVAADPLLKDGVSLFCLGANLLKDAAYEIWHAVQRLPKNPNVAIDIAF